MIGEYFHREGNYVDKPPLQLHSNKYRAITQVEKLIGGECKNMTKHWSLVSNGKVNVVISDDQ